MLLSNYLRGKDTAGGIKRIHCRINTLAGDLTGKYGGRIQMGKCSSRSRVCKVIGRYINSLYRCDGTLSGRSDTLLKGTHLSSQSWLITYSGRHTSKKCGNL